MEEATREACRSADSGGSHFPSDGGPVLDGTGEASALAVDGDDPELVDAAGDDDGGRAGAAGE